MGQGTDITAKADALRAELAAHLGIQGRDLAQALRRAGRRLPRRIRQQAKVIEEAARLGGNPKLERRLDATRIEKAHAEVMAHLTTVNRADVRRGRLLGLAAVLAFNFILIATAFVFWLWWRGYV